MTCDKCGHEFAVGDFPFCKGNPTDHKPGKANVIGDECDVWMRHGLCNADGSPRHYTSKEAIRRDEKKAKLTNYVEHRPYKGSDKSPFTSRWV
jgi:hypothetical protein